MFGSWPAHTTEARPYKQARRQGQREDRLFGEVLVSLPPMIAEQAFITPPNLVSALERAVADMRELEAVAGDNLGALATFLVRTDSVASSKMEQLSASTEQFAKAIAGSKANHSATMMVAGAAAITAMVEGVGASQSIDEQTLLLAHERLMRAEPSEAAWAGKYREAQNWIGGSDYSPRDALFVPPPPELVSQYMNDLMLFCNRDDLPAVAQAAIAHAQFESIHPFTDGNGRIGRALLNAVLRRRGVNRQTITPVAAALVAQRDSYFDALTKYRQGDAVTIIKQVAVAAQIAARESLVSALSLASLPEAWHQQVKAREGSAIQILLGKLLNNPVMAIGLAERITSVSTAQVYLAMQRLEDEGVVHELTGRQRDKVWGATGVLQELDSLASRIGSAVKSLAQGQLAK